MLTRIGSSVMTARKLLHDKRARLYLVSYPRAGSHWVRLILETLTGRPSAVTPLIHKRGFGLGKVCVWHVHDVDLTLGPDLGSFMYVYRHPREVLKSNLIYFDAYLGSDEDLAQVYQVLADEYMQHLRYYTQELARKPRRIAVSYEDLQTADLPTIRRMAFLVGRFTDQTFSTADVQTALAPLTKQNSQTKTQYNKRVIRSVDESIPERIYSIIDQNPSNALSDAYENLVELTRSQP